MQEAEKQIGPSSCHIHTPTEHTSQAISLRVISQLLYNNNNHKYNKIHQLS